MTLPKPEAQTLPGSYSLIPMPDGQEVMMHKTLAGKWVITEEQVALNDTARFAPHTDKQVATETLTIDPSALHDNLNATKNRIRAYLIEILGTPEAILAEDPLAVAAVRKCACQFQAYRQVIGLIDILGDPTWCRARATFAKLLENVHVGH